MIKHLVLAGVATLALAVSAPALAASTGTVQAAAPRASTPVLGAWGVDTAGMDKSVKPGDSFYNFVNGTWDRTTQIPADRSSWGGFGVLRDLSDTRTREIIEAAAREKGAPGTNAQKVGDYYASFMDEAAIEAKGVTPLKPYLERINAIRTTTDLARAFGEANRTGIGTPVSAGVEQDLKDNTQYSIYLGQGGLGLPDRDYYLDTINAKFAEARTRYQQHIATMLQLAGITDPAGKASCGMVAICC